MGGLDGSDAARVRLSFLKIIGGQGEDRGEFARQNSLFEGRFQYNEAYLAGVFWPIRGFLNGH